MSEADVRVFPTLQGASEALAAEVARELIDAVEARERATIALSGGSTPRPLHKILAAQHGEIPWDKVHIFWGDERFVPRDSEDSNYRMARETLLDDIEIPDENVHPWQTETGDPDVSALAMQMEMERVFGCTFVGELPPRFDVLLMGLGENGHTASLFPNTPALQEARRWAIPSEATYEPRRRLTMTLPVLGAGRHIHFLVAGENKREALQCALSGPSPDCPASLVVPADGTLTWWLDEEVAP